MPKVETRQSLPTSSTAFALPPSTSTADADANPLLHRFRRPSLLAPKATKMPQSPLAPAFSAPSSPRRRGFTPHVHSTSDESEMQQDSSSESSSQNTTPPLLAALFSLDDSSHRRPSRPRSRPPATPPRRSSFTMDGDRARKVSVPLKQQRIMSLLSESKPEETEVKSEAAFQRLVASCSELPNGSQPRTPRTALDRGRFPEEYVEESQREDTPSDDEEHATQQPTVAYSLPSTESLVIEKSVTPSGSLNGEDLSPGMSVSESSSSVGTNTPMDIDAPTNSSSQSIPSLQSATPMSQWRYTPPPTTSAIRSNKRKLEDRFDPYPNAAKRRAVSPSISQLRDSHSNSAGSVHTRTGPPRLPLSIPIPIPGSACNSATSSPTISSSYPTTYPRPTLSITSSPTMRTTHMGLISPVVRPVPRPRREEEEREMDGAGDAVHGLTLS